MPKVYVVPFNEVEEYNACEIGGKATNLGLMYRRMPEDIRSKVPNGFGIKGDAFTRYVDANRGLVDGWVRKVRKAYEENRVDEIVRDYREFERKFIRANMPREIRDEINQTYENLCKKENVKDLSRCKVAVRSSAICEDCATASLAGRFSSFVDISGKKRVEQNVKKVWASAFEPRAIHHRDVLGISVENDKMGVAVQRFIHARCAGVMLTSPTGDGSLSPNGSLQVVTGTGEDVVQGTKVGDYIEFDKTAGKKVFEMPSPTGEGCALSDRHMRDLVRIANTLEQFYGQPQDVEFVIDSGKLYIVQTRPVVPMYACPKK